MARGHRIYVYMRGFGLSRSNIAMCPFVPCSRYTIYRACRAVDYMYRACRAVDYIYRACRAVDYMYRSGWSLGQGGGLPTRACRLVTVAEVSQV